MSIIERMPKETPAAYAQRMIEVVNVVVGRVHSQAGMHHDLDEVIAELDWIAEHADDPAWDECLQLQQEIQRVISRMTSATHLNRVLCFAREIAR